LKNLTLDALPRTLTATSFVEVIGFNRALQLTKAVIGQSGIAQPVLMALIVVE
jgi:hypothetical protein